MPKFKKTKWVNYKFTKQQRTARAIWENSENQYMELCESLLFGNIPNINNRTAIHDRLDYILDRVEHGRAKAKEIFPEVQESFTYASLKL